MKVIKNVKGRETHIFAETFEQEAWDQIKKLADFEPYSEAKIRIMPDAHAGKGCTVGTTMTITDKITPNLVGVDIGCGMLTLRLKEEKIDFNNLDDVINTHVPHGFNIHRKVQKEFDLSQLRCIDHVDAARARLSLGSLGGGNHFIEVGRARKSGHLYLVIHSGSRKLGSETCGYYQNKALAHAKAMSHDQHYTIKKLKAEGRKKEIAAALKKQKKGAVPHKDLAFLTGTDFDDYMNDMAIVQQYASQNRITMAGIILRETGLHEQARFETIHNYIDFRRMILRKGAVSAEKDETLLIPINMRDGSLLCVGKGNADWNYSAPHGAGRLMSRSKAKKSIPLQDFLNEMKDIHTTSAVASTLDEAPQAYKSMEEITASITPTAEIIDVIKPLYNFKAH